MSPSINHPTGQATLARPMWRGVLYLPRRVLHQIKGVDLMIDKITEARVSL